MQETADPMQDRPARIRVRGRSTSTQVALLASLLCASTSWTSLWAADQAQQHWAYRPLVDAPVPCVAPPFDRWARSPLDAFVVDRLLERGLSPSPPADRRALLRRLHFDLIGLPPTPRALEEFLRDSSPGAYERVVDRLLSSPHLGERWARHWMDVVHFAETHGQDQDRPREHAWPYRDYLVRSFNEDTPYGLFIEEQVAGDVLFPDDPWAIVATGFLAAGPWDESSLRDIRPDSIDRVIGHYLDRDDVVRTTMSTFVSTSTHCARCHDHKFDPISQREYYGLQAVFAGIDKANRAYDRDPGVARRRRQLTTELERLRGAGRDAKEWPLSEALQREARAWERRLGTSQSWQAWQVLHPDEFRSASGATLTRLEDGSLLAAGDRPEKDTYTIVASTRLERITAVRLEVLTHDSLPHGGPGRQENGNLHLSEFVVRVADGAPVEFVQPVADFDQGGWTIAHAVDGNPVTAWGIYPQVGKPHLAVLPFATAIDTPGGAVLNIELKQLHGGRHLIGRPRLSVTAADPPFAVTPLPTEVRDAIDKPPAERSDEDRVRIALHVVTGRLERELAALGKPSLVYCGTRHFKPDGTFTPAAKPRTIHLLERGEIHRQGPEIEPATLSVIEALPRLGEIDAAGDEGARRRALARWLSDRRNVLTWRSIVNRVWHHHFGRGLVATPNDFGQLGSEPTHPELLDWLAVNLLRNGGSLKWLHRTIVTSATYRQSSALEDAHAAIDSDNRFLWRADRRRLDAESLRDAVLAIAGTLDTTLGGPSAKQFIQSPGIHVTPKVDYLNFDVDAPENYRRSVYRFVFRTLPDPFMKALDCPDASRLAPRRNVSITAVQALATLNDKILVRQSERLAERLRREIGEDLRACVGRAYELILSRSAAAWEVEAVVGYASEHGLPNACRVLFNSNEFLFVD